MAYWGQALVLGPNINAPMEPNDEPQARAGAEGASLKGAPHAREQAYIDALAQRYTGKAGDRASRAIAAYADAMRACTSGSPTTSTPRCSTRVGDGPAAVGLLAARRRAARAHAEIVALTERCSRAIPTIPARCTCTST